MIVREDAKRLSGAAHRVLLFIALAGLVFAIQQTSGPVLNALAAALGRRLTVHLRDRVMALASKIAEKSPVALRMAKEAVKSASRMNLREGLDRETDLFSLTFASEDKTEGVRAFLEKRKPDFKGR